MDKLASTLTEKKKKKQLYILQYKATPLYINFSLPHLSLSPPKNPLLFLPKLSDQYLANQTQKLRFWSQFEGFS